MTENNIKLVNENGKIVGKDAETGETIPIELAETITESLTTEETNITGSGPNIFHDLIVAEGGIEMDGNELENLGGGIRSPATNYHYAGNFEGSSPIQRLENAISESGDQDTIYLENGSYEGFTLQNDRVLIGTSTNTADGTRLAGSGGDFTIDVLGARVYRGGVTDGKIIVNADRVELKEISFATSGPSIEVNGDSCLISHLNGFGGDQVVFASGTEDGEVGIMRGAIGVDNQGTNSVL